VIPGESLLNLLLFGRLRYGKSVRPVNIIVKKEVSNPKSAKLREALAKIARGDK
jgi:hypothetical protein